MFQVRRGTRANLGKGWRRKVRERRIMDTIALLVGLLLSWWLDSEPEVALTIREHWPMAMVFILPTLLSIAAGKGPDDEDLELMAMAAGDEGPVENYPPEVQAALMRLVRAGEYQQLTPLTHRLLWRMGIPFPPMAFSPWWLNALVRTVSAFTVFPLWMYVQYWWNPDFGGEMLAATAGMLMFVLGLIVVLVSYAERGTRERLELPAWSEFRKDWRLRGR